MGRIETALIRHYLKPTVTSDLPGRLRLSFKGYQMLPKEALPYLHYVQDVMTMLPGVRGVGLAALRTPLLNCVDGGPDAVAVYAPAAGLMHSAARLEYQMRQEFENGASRV